jgi:predicted DNA binding CopG/RHH family protein
VAIYVSKLTNVSDEEKQIVPYIEHYIERNFGGIIYEIDIDFDFELEDKEKIEEIFRLKLGSKFKDAYKKKKGENKIKVSSVYIFKNIYNFICEDEKFKNVNYKIPKIEENYGLNKCINENINDINSRYLFITLNRIKFISFNCRKYLSIKSRKN